MNYGQATHLRILFWLMSPQVGAVGRPGPRLNASIGVQGTSPSTAHPPGQIGDVVGYAPMENPHETFNAKGFFIDWERLHPVMCWNHCCDGVLP